MPTLLPLASRKAFKPGVHLTRLPGGFMLNKGVFRPVVNRRTFMLYAETFEIPTFENADAGRIGARV